MNISVEKEPKGLRIKLSGELTIYEAQNTFSELSAVEGLFDNNLTLDLSEVSDCDTSGIQMLVYLHKKLSPTKTLHISKMAQEIERIIELLQLSDIFPVGGDQP